MNEKICRVVQFVPATPSPNYVKMYSLGNRLSERTISVF
jgi:hypothetical protein